jgi:hypothetical protein
MSMSLLGNNSIKTFPQLRRIVEGVVFYAVRVITKESRNVVRRTACFFMGCLTTLPVPYIMQFQLKR